jgi:hypothetical protein
MQLPRQITGRILSAGFRAPYTYIWDTLSQCLVFYCVIHSLHLAACRTVYLHCQICWNIQVSKTPVIALNIIGWVVPAIFFAAIFAVSDITYTISNHCSIQVDWVINLLIIPLICEIGCSLVVQVVTFAYCINIYLRSLREPVPPTNESVPFSTISYGSSRYPYRKALRRIKQVFSWVIC